MNTKEIAEKYSLNLDKLNMVVLNSDLRYKRTMFNGIEVADSVQLVLEKYNRYDVEKEEKALAEKAAEKAAEEEKARAKEEEKRKEEEAKKRYEENVKKNKEVRSRARHIIVTTGDIKDEYEIIGPVYFQVSNKGLFGSTLDTYKSLYRSEIEKMKTEGTMSQDTADWGFLYGEWSVGQNNFESAFYIAVQELKVRAALVGGDAIISMRQDIDLDTNGFSFFYLQMYGTAVKLRKMK